jgi:hypothetical protein
VRVTRTTILSSVLIAAAAVASVTRAEPEFSADRIKAHVSFLADDLLEGREAGTRGHEIAARYIASQFALSGVKPGGRANGYFQPVTFVEATASGPPATVVLTTARGAATLKQGGTVIVRGPMAGGAVTLDAPLVFVGYGMKDDTVGYDDYAGVDARGKVAVVLWGSPKGMDSEVGAHLQSEQEKVAAEHGAAGIILVPTRASATAFPWPQLLELGSDPRTTWMHRCRGRQLREPQNRTRKTADRSLAAEPDWPER